MLLKENCWYNVTALACVGEMPWEELNTLDIKGTWGRLKQLVWMKQIREAVRPVPATHIGVIRKQERSRIWHSSKRNKTSFFEIMCVRECVCVWKLVQILVSLHWNYSNTHSLILTDYCILALNCSIGALQCWYYYRQWDFQKDRVSVGNMVKNKVSFNMWLKLW